MESKDTHREFNEPRRERFEFVLSINENIICQRFFRINGFNELSLWSIDLKNTIDDIVDLIDSDLKSKSRVYMYYAYDTSNPLENDDEYVPKPFNGIGESYRGNTVTEVESVVDLTMTRLADKVVFKQPDEVLQTIGVYDKPIEKNGVKTYINNIENQLKFEFKVDGRTVMSKIWSGDVYPSFVRNNIDITNKKYASDNVDDKRLTRDAQLIRQMVRYDYDETHESVTKNRPNSLVKNGNLDLIRIIIKMLCDTCSYRPYYNIKHSYGDTVYNVRFQHTKEDVVVEKSIMPISYCASEDKNK